MTRKEANHHLTPDDIDQLAKIRLSQAERLPLGNARQTILKEVIQLRAYANMKRALEPADAETPPH